MQNRENNRGNQNQQTRENPSPSGKTATRTRRKAASDPVFLSCAAGLVPAAQLFSVLFFPLPLVFSPIS